VLEALDLVKRSTATDRAYARAEDLNRKAREALEGISSRYRDTLEALTDDLLVRRA